MGTVQIFQLDENDNRTYGVELLEAFPKTIGAQTLVIVLQERYIN